MKQIRMKNGFGGKVEELWNRAMRTGGAYNKYCNKLEALNLESIKRGYPIISPARPALVRMHHQNICDQRTCGE